MQRLHSFQLGRTDLVLVVLLLVLGSLSASAFENGVTERVSVASDGTQGTSNSLSPALSGDGRFVAFASEASNLVPGDTNNRPDVFVYDRQTGQTELISVNRYGRVGNDASSLSAISADGQCAAFRSDASDLIPGDTNNARDVFMRCRTAATTQVSSFIAEPEVASVKLKWDTVREVDIIGFHLYRAADNDFERLTDTPIPAQGDTENGAVYEYVNQPGNGHHVYQLVSVDASGEEIPLAQTEAEVETEERHLFIPMLQR